MRIALVLLSVLMLSIAACKKNSDVSSAQANNNNNTNNSTNADTTMLATYFEIDTTITSGQDTINKSEYNYDNDKRVVSLKTYFYYSSLPTGSLKCTNYFFYNGNNTLPNIRIDDYTGAGIPHPHRDSVFLFYDATGKLVLDSVVQYFPSPTQPQIMSYKYAYSFNASSGMYIVDITRSYYSGSPQVSQDHTEYVSDASGNPLVATVQNAQFFYPQSYDFGYDANPNPFHVKGCRDYSPFTEYSGIPLLYDYYGMSFSLSSSSPNNITTVDKSYFDGGGTLHNIDYTYNYTYRSDGYPNSSTFYENSTGTPAYKKKGFYQYTH